MKNNKIPDGLAKNGLNIGIPKGEKKQFPSKFEDIKNTNNPMNQIVKKAAAESNNSKNKNPFKYDHL